MRLSTARDRDDDRGVAVIRAALDAGVTLLDTAPTYAHDEADLGHNERLIARALAEWTGDRSRITVATKGGMRRPKGAWMPDGRAKHLRESCEASRRALGVDTIDLYQLHVVDPKTPIETSVRALARLHDDGLIRTIGLCNVTVSQIETARAIAPIASVQVSLSPLDDENLRNGVAEFCRENGIRVVAHRPLGGERVKRLSKDHVLQKVAGKHGVTGEEVALAWLMSFDAVTPIPGATRTESAVSIGRARQLTLDDDDRTTLDARFSGALLRVPRARRRPAKARGDVVLVMGMPGAGKSTFAESLEGNGYSRLNRDALGGSLSDLVPRLDSLLESGNDRVVLDNTYPTRSSRNEVIETAWRHGVTVRCIWLTTGVADAQINSIRRMIGVHGSLPGPEEIKSRGKADARYLLPDAQFRYERTLEAPTADEGFERVDRHAFQRSGGGGTARALMFDFDDLATVGPTVLADHREEGWIIFAHAWRPGDPAQPTLPEAFGPVDISVCVHEAGPPICWCRKPIPGAVLEFAVRRDVDLTKSIVVGRSPADRTMAERVGAAYRALDTVLK